MIERVKQRHGFDCSIAAIAMLAGVSYAAAAKAVFGKVCRSYGTTRGQELAGLRRLGCMVIGRSVVPNGRRGNQWLGRNVRWPAILMYNNGVGSSWLHCCVFDPLDGVVSHPDGMRDSGYRVARRLEYMIELRACRRPLRREKGRQLWLLAA